MTLKPEIKLFSYTNNPLDVIALAIDVWHEKDFDEKQYTADKLVEKFRWLLKQPHQTPFEYVNTVWIIKNVSRAFQQQLTRHRVGFSYSIQSLRIVDAGNFADEGRFTLPESVIYKQTYYNYMKSIQDKYKTMIVTGEKIEDARGILPLNIHSPITMSCSYRSLLGLLKQRLCVAAQEEWKLIAEGIRQELMKVHPVFAEPIDCLCNRFKNGKGFCKTLHYEVNREGIINKKGGD